MSARLFDKKTIFFAAPSDMARYRDQIQTEVDRYIQENGYADRYQTYCWKNEEDPDAGVTWQGNIGSPLDPNCVLTIVLLGERIGEPVRALRDFEAQRIPELVNPRADPLTGSESTSIAAEWGVDVESNDPAKVPLTGTVFEFLEAMLACERRQSAVSVFVCGDGAQLKTRHGDSRDLERNFGFRRHYDTLKDAAGFVPKQVSDAYFQQLEGVARLHDRALELAKPWRYFSDGDDLSKLVKRRMSKLVGGEKAANDRLSFPGPFAIRANPAAGFSGRSRRTSEVERELKEASRGGGSTRPWALVHGPTGAGKSSFARRGVGGEALKSDPHACVCEYDVSEYLGLVARHRQENAGVEAISPIAHLAQCIAQALGDEPLTNALRTTGSALTPEMAVSFLRDAIARNGWKQRHIIIVVDQAELMLARYAEGASRSVPVSELLDGWDAVIDLLDRLTRTKGASGLAAGGGRPAWVVMTAPTDPLRQERAPRARSRGEWAPHWRVRLKRDELEKPMSKAEALVWSDAMQRALTDDQRMETILIEPIGAREVEEILDHGFEQAELLTPDSRLTRSIAEEYARLAATSHTSVMPLLGVFLADFAEVSRRVAEMRRVSLAQRGAHETAEEDMQRPFSEAEALQAGMVRLGQVLHQQADDALRNYVVATFGSEQIYQERADADWNEAWPVSGVSAMPVDDVRVLLAKTLRGLVSLSMQREDDDEDQSPEPSFVRTLSVRQFGDDAARLLRCFAERRLVLEAARDRFKLAHEGLLDWWGPARHWFDRERELLQSSAEIATYCGFAKHDLSISTTLARKSVALIGAQGDTDALISRAHRNVIYRKLEAAHAQFTPEERGEFIRDAAAARDDLLVGAVLDPRAPEIDIVKWLHLGERGQGDPLLLHVLRHGHAYSYQRLRDAGAPTSIADRRGLTLVHELAWRGEAGELESVLREKAEDDGRFQAAALANRRTPSTKRTPMFMAVSSAGRATHVDDRDARALAIVKALRKFDADPAITSDFGRTALHEAARHGLTRVTKLLARDERLLEMRNEEGQTPLHLAAFHGHEPCVDVLIERMDQRAIDLTDKDEREPEGGRTALWNAVRSGHAKIVKKLLRKGADPNRVSRGVWLLHRAALTGNGDTVRALVDAGARMDVLDRRGDNVMHYAARSGSVSVIDVLRARASATGVDLLVRGQAADTPLHAAADAGQVAAAMRLGAKRADVREALDDEGSTPLASACRRASYERAGVSGAVQIAMHLIKLGANKQTCDAHGRTPLHLASGAPTLAPLVSALLSSKGLIDVEARAEFNETPLHEAAGYGDAEIVELLLAAGASPLARNGEERVPLHIAAWRGNLSTLAPLLKASGAAALEMRAGGRTPLHLAANKGGLAAVEYLLQAGADPRQRDEKSDRFASDFAAHRGDLPTLQKLLSALAPYPSILHAALASAVRSAAHGAALETLEWLIDQKAPLNAVSSRGGTAMHAALSANRASPERIAAVVKMLASHGERVDAPDGHGRTPADYAARLASPAIDAALGITSPAGPVGKWKSLLPIWDLAAHDNVEALDRLSRVGVSPNTPDANFNRPLHHAAKHGALAAVRRLIESGADVAALNWRGDTPFHVAASAGALEILEVLGTAPRRPSTPPIERVWGWTPLHIAAWRATVSDQTYLAMTRLFAEWGWATDTPDARGRTPAELARNFGKRQLLVVPRKKPLLGLGFLSRFLRGPPNPPSSPRPPGKGRPGDDKRS